jgi:uncharacterized membrane protein
MLIMDLYSLLPAFTVASFLGVLLWPENISFKNRLRLFAVILLIWFVASLLGMMEYGTTEKPLVCFVNVIVGFFGLIALLVTYRFKPSRTEDQEPRDGRR